MSTARKYADLLDIDPAPDIYETPELTDDTSTHPTSATTRSDSPDNGDEAEGVTGIDRHRLDADEARTRFLSSDERESNLSSRISSKRRSYRSSSRKRRKDGQEPNGLINGLETSSDNEEESLERKVARLKREVTEVKAEYDQKKVRFGPAQNTKEVSGSLDALSQVLDSVTLASATHEKGAADRMARRLLPTVKSDEPSETDTSTKLVDRNRETSAVTVSYAPGQDTHALSRISDFDSRLGLIEVALGIDAIPLPTQDRTTAKAVIPSLEALDKQLTTISTSTESSLESIGRRVKQLTEDAEKLEHARKAARAAQEALKQELFSTSADSSRLLAEEVSNASDIEDPDSISKINALYGTLPTIESLAPMLPSVLDRLRSLRSLHADAANACQALTKLESRQEEMKQELQGWKDGLEKVEKAMEQGEETMKTNTETVDGWVKDLESRMGKLGQ